jgi:hypothetical protein
MASLIRNLDTASIVIISTWMTAARNPKKPKLISVDRSEVPQDQIHAIDSTLKQLRGFAQQLKPLEECFQDELRVLERLYYKGVNQHRSALFWRRIEEVRKLGRRFAELRVTALVDNLRYAFYTSNDSERK